MVILTIFFCRLRNASSSSSLKETKRGNGQQEVSHCVGDFSGHVCALVATIHSHFMEGAPREEEGGWSGWGRKCSARKSFLFSTSSSVGDIARFHLFYLFLMPGIAEGCRALGVNGPGPIIYLQPEALYILLLSLNLSPSIYIMGGIIPNLTIVKVN